MRLTVICGLLLFLTLLAGPALGTTPLWTKTASYKAGLDVDPNDPLHCRPAPFSGCNSGLLIHESWSTCGQPEGNTNGACFLLDGNERDFIISIADGSPIGSQPVLARYEVWSVRNGIGAADSDEPTFCGSTHVHLSEDYIRDWGTPARIVVYVNAVPNPATMSCLPSFGSEPADFARSPYTLSGTVSVTAS